ncbi:alpha-mannosidase [Anaerostipes sp. 494a]|uniref:alpha/beta hydrolase n=1 Tax=unclassified Anaerostipes TaxID=2635253 RepID=UPI0009519A51|nr:MULTISPECIES: alpha/beta hydrolase-fold protein [unclassified Anaerostipes]MCI5623603.1 alpha/beta hydrolase-fold protein [Anaerostipes sp.]MDY2726932.1 alpha/beta hydrolase-fold protein [Anaerostipes faecalis]OLR58498.1 alpha-mannosidase [Anaerostipes sp. 494a]
MIYKWDITIPELTGAEPRSAYIYLPESYNDNPERHYPVLYMFDGHNVFFDSDATYGKCWGMKEYMDQTSTQLIVAAVECNHSPDNGRLREYSPFTFKDSNFGKITGLGKLTMEWLINDFKKDIDSRFRTIPDREHTYIAGSSMGGLMSLYALMEYNNVFSKAAALSPSLWTAPKKIISLIKNSMIQPDTVLYMDYGSNELNHHDNMLLIYEKIARNLLHCGVLLNSRIVPGGDHCEASWEQQIPFFMHTLLY